MPSSSHQRKMRRVRPCSSEVTSTSFGVGIPSLNENDWNGRKIHLKNNCFHRGDPLSIPHFHCATFHTSLVSGLGCSVMVRCARMWLGFLSRRVNMTGRYWIVLWYGLWTARLRSRLWSGLCWLRRIISVGFVGAHNGSLQDGYTDRVILADCLPPRCCRCFTMRIISLRAAMFSSFANESRKQIRVLVAEGTALPFRLTVDANDYRH